jgi:site-specific recombinase XerD
MSTQGIARILEATAEVAGVATRVTPHIIRHTTATLLLRFGADIRVAQEALGHASIATTQRYNHISKEHLFDTLRARHPNHHPGIDQALHKSAS